MNSKSLKLLVLFSVSFFLIVLSLASYFAFQFHEGLQKESSAKINSSCPNIPVVSFEIDDISFNSNQQDTLNNALEIAREDNVTFDLGVIANQFANYKDNQTFQIYQNNTDVFELIAHGFTHALDISTILDNPGSYGEFYILSSNKSIPYSIQENHIKKMKDIFNQYNLTSATQIFTVPYHAGDFNTTILAEIYGYKLIIQKITSPQTFSEVKFGNIVESQDYIDIPIKSNFTASDVLNYSYQIDKALRMGQKRIDVSFHPQNFQWQSNINSFINRIMEASPDVSYRFLSDRFNCPYE